jgi:DNA polymerase-3 subunit delta
MAKRSRKSSSAEGPSFTGDELIVVITGDDNFLIGEYQRQFREAVEKKADGEIDVLTFDGKAELADVLDELRSVGLMMQTKIVVVTDADEFVTAHREKLERYADDPAAESRLVIRPTKWNAQWRLHKAIEKVGAVAKTGDLTEAAAEKWLIDRAKTMHKRKLKAEAAALLVERIGATLGRLDGELAKVVASAGDRETIEADDVIAVVGRSSEADAWAIQSALLSGDATKAVGTLNDLIDLAGHHEQFMAYWFADLARKMCKASIMAEGRSSDYEICSSLRIWPKDRQKPFMDAVRRLGRRGTTKLLGMITEMDARAKSGSGDARRNLEQICVLLSMRLG